MKRWKNPLERHFDEVLMKHHGSAAAYSNDFFGEMIDAAQEDRDYEFNARYDDVRERFGDRCPVHPGVLRGGGDCYICESSIADLEALDQMADRPGQFTFSELRPAIRKSVMLRLREKGWRDVVCAGQTIRWK